MLRRKTMTYDRDLPYSVSENAIHHNNTFGRFPSFTIDNLSRNSAYSERDIVFNPLGYSNKSMEKYVGVFGEKDVYNPVNIVTKGYKLIQHELVYNAFSNYLDNPDLFDNNALKREEDISFSPNGAKMVMKFKFPALAVNYYSENQQDTIKRNFFVIVKHGVDGDWGLTSGVGLMDFACANMEMAGKWESFKVLHTRNFNINDYLSVQKNYMDTFYSMRRKHTHQLDTYMSDAMVERYLLSIPDWSTQVCDADGRKMVNHDRTPKLELNKPGNAIYDQWIIEKRDRRSNLYALSSALTYWASHDSDEFPVRKRSGHKNVVSSLHERQKLVSKLTSEQPFEIAC